MPTELPFKKEEGWDYILDEAGRQKFAPLQVTDECWHPIANEWVATVSNPSEGFWTNCLYRRRKSSGWVSGNQPPNNNRLVVVEGGVASWDGMKWISETSSAAGRPIQWTVYWWTELPTPPQPPKPAAEVAFEDYWHKETAKAMGYLKDAEAKAVWLAAIEWAKAHKGEI